MSEPPVIDRFKPNMPEIPGVAGGSAGPSPKRPVPGNPAPKLIVGLLAVLIVIVIGARFMLHTKQADPSSVQPPPQIQVPAPAPDPSTLLPHATEGSPEISSITDMAKPWTSKPFYFRNHLTGEDIPALLVRLPGGSGSQSAGYWAFALKSPYGNCQLEFISDLDKLRNDYGFAAAKHPMVGNPCSHTLFDPLKMANLPGDVWVRGGMAQGSDLRPPLGIEIKIKGRDVLAVSME
jgi:hypothetical protein